jgi:hypothetical protein
MNGYGYLFNLAGYPTVFSIRYPASKVRYQPDTGYKKGRIIRPDILCIPKFYHHYMIT